MFTNKQQEIFDTLKKLYKEKNEPISPTEIGLALGKDYNSASSYCSATLKKCVEKNLVQRTQNGRYAPIEDTE